MHARKPRFKVQHELTMFLDDCEIAEVSSISTDQAVTAQFLGSITSSMSLPFNSCLIPRYILDSLDNYAFSYALAWHAMMPLFAPSICSRQQLWDSTRLPAHISMLTYFYTTLSVIALRSPHGAVSAAILHRKFRTS